MQWAYSDKQFPTEHFMVGKFFPSEFVKKEMQKSEWKNGNGGKKLNENRKKTWWSKWKNKDDERGRVLRALSSCTNTCNCDNLLERSLFFSLTWLQPQLLFSPFSFIPFLSVPFLLYIYAIFPSNFVGRFPNPMCMHSCVWLCFFSLVVLLHLINYLPYTRLVLSMRATLLFICHSRKCVCLCVYNNTQFSMCVSMNEWMSKFALFVFLFIVIQHAICWFWKWNARFVVFLLFVFPFYNCYRVRACFCLTTLCVSFVILLCIHCLCVCVVLLCVSECVFYQLLATLLIKKSMVVASVCMVT